jgi:hypothetical protein
MAAIVIVKVLPLRSSLMGYSILWLIVTWAWIIVEWASFSLISHGIFWTLTKIRRQVI